MPIYRRCRECKADNPSDKSICRKCAASLEECSYIVQVSKGRSHLRRSAKSLEDALRAEIDLLKTATTQANSPRKATMKAVKAIPSAINMPQQGQCPTLQDVWERYYRHARLTIKHPKHPELVWRLHVAPTFANIQLNNITPSDVEDFLLELQEKRVKLAHNTKRKDKKPLAPQTIFHAYKLLRRLFNYAIERQTWHGSNPASKVKPKRFKNEITRSLTKDQAKRLIAVLDSWDNRPVALAFKALLLTGKRASEIFGLEWDQVDLQRSIISFKIKSEIDDEKQYLPISKGLCSVLEDAMKWQYPGSRLVFPTKNGKRFSHRNYWERLKRNAGLPEEMRTHDLRHSFASELVNNGVDLYAVQALLGHKNPSTTQRYAHLRMDALRRSLAVVEATFLANR